MFTADLAICSSPPIDCSPGRPVLSTAACGLPFSSIMATRLAGVTRVPASARSRAAWASAAGFTDLTVVQIGNDTQEELVRWAEKELLPAVREL